MLFRSYVPQARLSAIIDDFWLYEDYAGAHAHERILPSGTFEMVFNLWEDELRIYGPSDQDVCRRFSGALISGPYARPFMSDTEEEAAFSASISSRAALAQFSDCQPANWPTLTST
jgi:hypothetical protein